VCDLMDIPWSKVERLAMRNGVPLGMRRDHHDDVRAAGNRQDDAGGNLAGITPRSPWPIS
jgi:hypothetical protein